MACEKLLAASSFYEGGVDKGHAFSRPNQHPDDGTTDTKESCETGAHDAEIRGDRGNFSLV